MFISLPTYEFPFPEGLADPDVKHWRVVELRLHAPWFLLTVEQQDPDDDEMTVSYTLCIAWGQDLADALKSIDAKRVRGLVAMMPAWCSPTGHWSSRQITEVWLRRDDSGQQCVALKDVAGEEFIGDFCGEPVPPDSAPELLLRLLPRKVRKPRARATAAGHARGSARPK